MMLFSRQLIVSVILFIFSATTIHADAKSDYEYQYSRYRQNIIEFNILKNDYRGNPTLDNQQKAVLSARQTISSRDLAKAYYAEYLLSLCEENKINYPPIQPITASLRSAGAFFRSSAEASTKIASLTDLKDFTNQYLLDSAVHDQAFRIGVVAFKISRLVYFQIELKNALDIIIPKLATPFSAPLQTRIDDLQSQGNKINDSINELSIKIQTEEDLLNINGDNYFTDKSEAVKNIKDRQLKWIDGLIDIDLNYAHL